jgi:hypothetical protein
MRCHDLNRSSSTKPGAIDPGLELPIITSLLRYFIYFAFLFSNKKRNPVPKSSNLLERLRHAPFAPHLSKV